MPTQIGAVSIAGGEPPARYSAPLPLVDPHPVVERRDSSRRIGLSALVFTDEHPPPDHAIDGITLGDPIWLDRLERSAADSVAAGSSGSAVVAAWSVEIRGRDNARTCTSAAQRARKARGAVADVMWLLVSRTCDEPAWVEVQAEAPPAAWFGRATRKYHRWPESEPSPWNDTFTRYLAERAVGAPEFDLPELAEAAYILGAPAAAVRDAYAQLPEGARGAFADGLANSTDPDLRALYCAHQEPPCVEARPKRAPEETPLPNAIIASALRVSGLLHADDPTRGDTPERALAAAGRLYRFDRESGYYPNGHDRLLRQLASLARPTLDGAIFEEIPPVTDAAGEPVGPYVLRGWHGGRVFEVEADEGLGDWYDTTAVLALLNAMQEVAGSPVRLYALAAVDQTLPVVAATPEALAAGQAAGWISVP